jgi:starch synthase (maltosyl-transferring)
VQRYPDRSHSSVSAELGITVDPILARFSSWYELFPRSQGQAGVHGTFADVIAQLPRIARMGFNVLYLPPIHPIGRTFRKGRNNALNAEEGDVGSPWAIGNENGGHKAIEPALGTFEDFARLVEAARLLGIHVAMDFAIQTSPDHPYVREHPEWYFVRPDGSIKYAENPPKKYQDIYPMDFYGSNHEALWEELKSIVLFWVDRGVTVFRVDNPHTKPIALWEWLIAEVKGEHPEVIFLAEAFTRPKVMRALAKAGFTQSYTYFAWRVTRWELTDYLTELTQSEMKEYFRGNLWPNTPDILHDFLQHGGLPAFRIRLILAATLSSDYGIYSGYELGINTPVHPGSEEYLDSDKYQLNYYEWDQPHSLEPLITRINAIRRANPALHLYDNLRFYASGSNDNIIVYGKATPDGQNRVLIAVNLDPFTSQDTWVGVPYWEWGFGPDEPYQVHDLLTGDTYLWRGEYNYVRLDPSRQPAHIFLVSRAGTPTPEFREINFS